MKRKSLLLSIIDVSAIFAVLFYWRNWIHE